MQSYAAEHPLLPPAFTAVAMPKADPTFLEELYSKEAAEYSDSLKRGTLTPQEKESLSEIEQKALDAFNGQFNTLIDFIKSQSIELHDGQNVEILENLDGFCEHFCSRTYYQDHGLSYYIEIKKSWEAIAYQLSLNDLLSNSHKRKILDDLCVEINKCPAGIPNLLVTTLKYLSTADSVDLWLAEFRTSIIKKYAALCAKKLGIREDSNVHIENVFLQHAREMNPLGLETIITANERENSYILRRSSSALFEDFDQYFREHYTPITIVKKIAFLLDNRIRCKLKESLDKAEEKENTTLQLKDHAALETLFSGIPLVGDGGDGAGNVIFTVAIGERLNDAPPDFSVVNEKYKGTPPTHYYLKPLPQLMRALMPYCLERGFFKGCESDEHFAYFFDAHPPAVQGCYRYSQGNALQSLEGVTPFEEVKQTGVPLSDELFDLYVNKGGVTDFSDTHLDQIDFADYKEADFAKLTFRKTQFTNQRVTLNQLIILIEAGATFVNVFIPGNEIQQKTREEKDTLLLSAAKNVADPAFIQLLLKSGAIPAKKDAEGRTAIQLVAGQGNWPGVQAFTIIREEHDKYHYGSALFRAAVNNQAETVIALIQAGASLAWGQFPPCQNDGGYRKETALHWAARHGNVKMTVALLRAGVNAELHNLKWKKAIVIAAEQGHWPCVKAFTDHHSDPDNKCNYGLALTKAARANQTEVAIALINAEASLYVPEDDMRMRPLDYAVHNGNFELVEALLKNGDAAKKENYKGQTALHFAVSTPRYDERITRLLLEKEADTAQVDFNGKTAIEIAVERKNWDCVILFIKHDRKQSCFHKVLHAAAQSERQDVVTALLGTEPDGRYPISAEACMAQLGKRQEPPRHLSVEEAARSLFFVNLPAEGGRFTFVRNWFIDLENALYEKNNRVPENIRRIILNHFNMILKDIFRADYAQYFFTDEALDKIVKSKKVLQYKLTGTNPPSQVTKYLEGMFRYLSVICLFSVPVTFIFCPVSAAMAISIYLVAGAIFSYSGYVGMSMWNNSNDSTLETNYSNVLKRHHLTSPLSHILR